MVRFFLVLLASLLTATASLAGERVALAIGNTNYAHTTKLPNAAGDAKRIGEILSRAGYRTVITETDLTYDKMRLALLAFRERAQNAEVAVVFYAGHGIQAIGENYLIPTDAKLAREADARLEAFSLNGILDGIAPPVRGGGAPFRVVILDACRTNTFALTPPSGAARGAARGLAPVGKRRDTIIAFSTAPNFVADDGSGQHSPYALALFKYISSPGMDVRKVFGFVYDDTMERTRNAQEPDLTVKLGGRDYFLVEGAPSPAPVVASAKQDFVVYFDFDRANVSAEGASVVEAAATFAISKKAKAIRVNGHSDGHTNEPASAQASAAYSQKLSERMASNVAAALVSRGVNGGIVTVLGFGATRPRSIPGDETAAAMNRRVEIEVSY